MSDFSKLADRTIISMLRTADRQKKHKREVMGRHKLGTSWHRRAAREFVVYVRQVKELEEELSRRELGATGRTDQGENDQGGNQ